jgi:hypothetical protein
VGREKRWAGLSARLVAELIVIFLGVFVALAADSWWEERSSDSRRSAYLLSLQSDLESAQAGLREDVATTESWIAEIERFGAWIETADSTEVTVPHLSLVTVVVPTGTMRALLSTGDINLFEDAELRSAIIRAESAIESALEERRLYAMTSSETAWDGAVAVQALRTSGRREGAATLPTILDMPSTAVRSDPILAAVFTHHRLTLMNDLAILRQVSEAVTELLSSVERAVGAL